MMRQISIEAVRRLAISKQHLDGRSRPAMLDVIRDIGCVQLDPISHIAPTHELVLWSRLGAYEMAELERLRWEDRALFEYWAHAASMVLTEEFPLYQWKMRQAQAHPRFQMWLDEHEGLPALRDRIVERLQREKAVFSRQFDDDLRINFVSSGWTDNRAVPRLLTSMWNRGEVAVVGRQGKQRQWGMMADFLPNWVSRERWTDEQVTRYALPRSLRALGVATLKQIKAHYTRGPYPKATAVLKQLVAKGQVLPVQVLAADAPLSGEWYLHAADVPLLDAIEQGEWHPRTTLLSPFDNLICDRDRTELLWDFYYRIEIYVPKDKREYGYYVLPILHGDRLIGRIDSKMDRKVGVYRIERVYAQPDAPGGAEVATAVRSAVSDLAAFLGADEVVWGQWPAGWR